jgi:hypothetical protein
MGRAARPPRIRPEPSHFVQSGHGKGGGEEGGSGEETDLKIEEGVVEVVDISGVLKVIWGMLCMNEVD